MFERLYPIKGRRPAEEILQVVAAARRDEVACRVTFATRPFERNWLFRIRAVRLRFERRDPPGPNGTGPHRGRGPVP